MEHLGKKGLWEKEGKFTRGLQLDSGGAEVQNKGKIKWYVVKCRLKDMG